MTSDDITPHEVWEQAVAAYAIGATDPADRQAFEEHLASCARCRQALAEFRRLEAALGLSADATAVELPPSLKAKTLARATAQPQVPLPGAGTPATAMPRSQRDERPASREPASSPSRRSAWPWLAAAACALVAVGLGWHTVALQGELGALRAQVAEATDRAAALSQELTRVRDEVTRLSRDDRILRAPDLVTVNLRGRTSAAAATGRAFVSPGSGLVFRADSLPALAPGRVYQLWVIPSRPGAAPVSAGILTRDVGDTYVLAGGLPASLGTVKTVAVTEEPAPAGSPGPTTAILLVGSLGE
jgi:anti-sigma factor RsiW